MELPPESSPAPTAAPDEFVIPEFVKQWDTLRKRIMSGLIVATVVLFAVLAGGIWFGALLTVAALLMIREWDTITAGFGQGWRVAGLAYVAIPCATFYWLRGLSFEDTHHAGALLVLYLVFVVTATDIAAFFVGRAVGGPKLAPEISPGKTWSGLAGGVAAAGVVGLLSASFTPFPLTASACFWTGVLLAIVSQGGDLFESWLKRRAGVKDSGVILPGHGGILDRVDGFVFATPLFGLMVGFSGLGV